MKLHNEMLNAMAEIIDAENAVKDWRAEIARRKRNLNLLIRTAKQIDPEASAKETADIIDALRAELTPADPAQPDTTDPATAEPDPA